MLFGKLLTAFATTLLATVSAVPVEVETSQIGKRDFGPVTIFTPPSTYVNERTLYARSLLLKDGSILTTWENYDWSGMPWFPIFKSTDHGFTWTNFSQAHDTQNGWGLRYQPFLHLLENDIGGFKAGTILLAGNSIPADLSKTQLELYASTDNGASWGFVSHIANGGKAVPNNGETPVWEPFLLEYKGQVICYYSDQRDPAHGQKLVYQSTSDLKNWGKVVDVEANAVYSARPGMPIISKMSNNQYFLTYENGGAAEVDFAVYYKIVSNPLSFGKIQGQALRTVDGHVPYGSPYNIWTPVGPLQQGTVVVNANSDSDCFINHNYGTGNWTRLTTQAYADYSRSLAVGLNPKDIVIVSGGALGMGPTNHVYMAARDVNGCSTC